MDKSLIPEIKWSNHSFHYTVNKSLYLCFLKSVECLHFILEEGLSYKLFLQLLSLRSAICFRQKMSETITMLQQSVFLSTADLFLLQLIIKRNVQELNQIKRDSEAISILNCWIIFWSWCSGCMCLWVPTNCKPLQFIHTQTAQVIKA